LQQAYDGRDQLGQLRRLLQVARAVQVLGVDEADEFGMLEVVTPDEAAELVERLRGLEIRPDAPSAQPLAARGTKLPALLETVSSLLPK